MILTIRIPVPLDRKLRLQTIGRCLAFLQQEDEHQLREDPSLPALSQTQVRYQREPMNSEEWITLRELVERGLGDCEDLSAGEAASERVREHMPEAKAVCRPSRAGYHCEVHNRHGVKDPSRERGM